MGLLGNILLAPVLGPMKGLMWIAGKVDEEVTHEVYDVDKTLAELGAANASFEQGEITLEAFEEREEELIRRLEVAHARQAA